VKKIIRNAILASVCSVIVSATLMASACAQAPAQGRNEAKDAVAPKAESVQAAQAPAEAAQEPQLSAEQVLATSQNVTLDFKDADINNVLKILSYKSGLNIVTTPDVTATVTIKLVEVPWEVALDVILKTYGYGYQRQGNVILVTKLENISKIQAEEPLQTDIFYLKFLDAQDAQKILVPLLSNRGKITVLYTRSQKGWQFGSFQIGKSMSTGTGLKKEEEAATKAETISIEKNAAGDFISRKADFDPSLRSKIMIITDTAAALDRVRNVILPMIDKRPKQVLIETKLVEISKNRLKDLGLDYGLGAITNAEGTTLTTQGLRQKNGQKVIAGGGRILGSEATPAAFITKEGLGAFAGTEPYNLGAQLILQKLTGTKMELIVHAIEEDIGTNTLSAPKILTLDNQEASILVGYATPILAATVTASSSGGSAAVSQTLDYYQEIGIRLNVIPQVNEDGYIKLMIHPSVTSSTTSLPATSSAGGAPVTTNYPVIDIREAQTQVLIKDGETIVIGGLLKDVKTKETMGVPFLSKIPIFGNLFKREINNTQKIDLLIFISARVVRDGDYSVEEIARLEENMGKDPVVLKNKKASSKK